uniref:Uncharacterized protein n=1 Tax=Rhizophagus irregularis (strain DAOM 181602 / DAOM 197198 / MUCL 43194) TaxID=747089 RepID=U9ULS5_RHIID
MDKNPVNLPVLPPDDNVVRQEINGEREKGKRQMTTVDGCIGDRTDKSLSLENFDLLQVTKDLEDIRQKKEMEKILFRTFRELVFSDYVGSSYISVPGPLGHGWSLDGLVEKEANMSKEVIHPSVKPEEVVKVIDDLRNSQQSRDLEEENGR